jgi:hypothetical protein
MPDPFSQIRGACCKLVRCGRAGRAPQAHIYQHKTTAAGQVIADALSAQIEALEQRDNRPATG